MEFHSELETGTCEGLIRLLRFAIGLRTSEYDQIALKRLEKRFRHAVYDPPARGALEDFARHLDGLSESQRFYETCSLLSGVLGRDLTLQEELADELLQICSAEKVIRFSFAQSLLLCLRHAHTKKSSGLKANGGYEIRYAGVGVDQQLMAFASLFLNLPIHTESGPPWVQEMIADDGEPIIEPPGLEVAFPPLEFKTASAPQFELGIRELSIPRAIDRGKYDLESVMLNYLHNHTSKALVFVSEPFLTSTKQSRLLTRQRLLNHTCIQQIEELKLAQPNRFLIILSNSGNLSEKITFVAAKTFRLEFRSAHLEKKHGRTSAVISVDDIRAAGYILRPSRYLGTGPAGGEGTAKFVKSVLHATEHKLADFFEIIRPKTTKKDPVGQSQIEEISAGNISPNGEIRGETRKFMVRPTVANGLDEQLIKAGDILFAHRGPIGNVAFVMDSDLENGARWAGQTVFILRMKRKNSSRKSSSYCDPRMLFMYLLTPKVREGWYKFVTDKRSPSIPIGQVESFSLPGNLVLSKKPKRSSDLERLDQDHSIAIQILSGFERRQDYLQRQREIQRSMDDGLSRVWKIAWEY